MKKALLCGVAVLLSLGLVTGCNNSGKTTEVKEVDATDLSLSLDRSWDPTTEVSLECGETHIIWTNLTPTDATNTLTWTTSDSSLVALEVSPNTQSATMTTVYTPANWSDTEETKTVTVTATTDNNLTASLKVTVAKPLGVSTVKTDVTLRATFKDSSGKSVTLPDYTDDSTYSSGNYVGVGQTEAFLGYGYDTGVYADGATSTTWKWYGAVAETKLEYASSEEEAAAGNHYYEVAVPIVTDDDGNPDEGLYAGTKYSIEIYVQVPLDGTDGVWDWSTDHTFTASVTLGQYSFPDEGGVIELEFSDPSDVVKPFTDRTGNALNITIVANNTNEEGSSTLTNGIFLSRHTSSDPWYESINDGNAMPSTADTDYAEYGDYYYTFEDVSKTSEFTFRMHYEAVTSSNYYDSGILPDSDIVGSSSNYYLWSYGEDLNGDNGSKEMGLALAWGDRYELVNMSEIIVVLSFDFTNGGAAWNDEQSNWRPTLVPMTYEITTVSA